MKLTKTQVTFLRKLATGSWYVKDGKPTSGIQALVDGGFCRLAREMTVAIAGNASVPTGQINIWISTAGRTVLELMDELAEKAGCYARRRKG